MSVTLFYNLSHSKIFSNFFQVFAMQLSIVKDGTHLQSSNRSGQTQSLFFYGLIWITKHFGTQYLNFLSTSIWSWPLWLPHCQECSQSKWSQDMLVLLQAGSAHWSPSHYSHPPPDFLCPIHELIISCFLAVNSHMKWRM